MNIRELPRLLFEEFGRNIRVYREQDNQNEEVRVADAYFSTLVWHDERFEQTRLRVFKNLDELENGYEPLIEISAGGFFCQRYEKERGSLYRDRAQVYIHPTRICLHCPSSLLVGKLLIRATEMIKSQAFELGEYFDQERNSSIVE